MFERLTKYAGKLADRNMNVKLGGGTLGLEDFVDDFYELEGSRTPTTSRRLNAIASTPRKA